MAILIPDFSSFQLDVAHAVRRAMRLCLADAFSSRNRLFSLVCEVLLAFLDFGVVAGEQSLARSNLFFGLRSYTSPNQPLQRNARDCHGGCVAPAAPATVVADLGR